jgi:hypothetical protein
MRYKLRGKVAFFILFSILLLFAISSYAGERRKRFEILFSAGGSFAGSRFVFTPSIGFSFYLMNNLAISADFGAAYHIPELDFREFGIPIGEAEQYTHVIVSGHYRLFSSISAEYSFELSPRFTPFVTAGVGWCRDYADIFYESWDYPYSYGWETYFSYDLAYRKGAKSPLLVLGGGIRFPISDTNFLKLTVRGLGPGSDFSTYQLIAGWGFRF